MSYMHFSEFNPCLSPGEASSALHDMGIALSLDPSNAEFAQGLESARALDKLNIHSS